MKKAFLTTGAACLAAVSMFTGCSSFKQQDPAAYLNKLNTFMDKAQGLEDHTRQPEQYLLPNSLLSSSKALYVSVAGAALDSIELRFGQADELYVAKIALDPNYIGEWNALRNADKDAAAAEKAAATLKKVIADAYATYKTRNKKSVDQLYDSVVGSVAQSDYIYYKKAVKDGDADEKIFTEFKTWCELGAKNVKRVAAEEAKVQEERAKKIEAAKKAAESDNRKVELVVQYYSCKAAIPGIKFGIAELKKALDPKIAAIACPFLENLLVNTMIKQMNDAAKEWPGVTTAIKDGVPAYQMPKFNAADINLLNIKPKMEAYAKEVLTSLEDWKKKAFDPYLYSLEIGGKRFGYTFKAWGWQLESYQAYKEAAAE